MNDVAMPPSTASAAAAQSAVVDLALTAASEIRAGFVGYNTHFRTITQRAQKRFESREWSELQADLVERIDAYDLAARALGDRLQALMNGRTSEKSLWAQIKGYYSALVAPLLDQELYKTFFNTITRRFFRTRGVDPSIEFVALYIEPTDRITHPVSRHSYSVGKNLWTLFRRVLDDFNFAPGYADPERCARRIAEAVSQQFQQWGSDGIFAVEMLTTVFYRERRAYLVGRIFGETQFAPLIIALRNDERGI